MSTYGVPGLRKVRRTFTTDPNASLMLKVEVLLVFDWLPTVHVGRNQPLTARHFWTEDMTARLSTLVGPQHCTFRGRNVRFSQNLYPTQVDARTPSCLADAVMEVLGSSYRTPTADAEKDLRRVRHHAAQAYTNNLRHVQFLMMLMSTRPETSITDPPKHPTMDEMALLLKPLSGHDRNLLWHENITGNVVDILRCSPALDRWHVADAIRRRLDAIKQIECES